MNLDAGHLVVHRVGGVHHVLEVPIQFQSRFTFHHALEIVRARVLERPFLEVPTHGGVPHLCADDGPELFHQDLTLGVGAHPVGTVGFVVVRVGDQWLFVARQVLTDVAGVGPAVWVFRRLHGVGKQVRHATGFCPRGEPFVHPLVQTFVGGHHGLEPAVGHFVHRHAHQAAQGALAGDEGDHGVFHAPVAALSDGVLRIGIGANVLVDEGHGLGGVSSKCRPIAVNLGVRLVDQSEVHVTHRHGLCDEVGVGGPCKINHILRLEGALRSEGALRPIHRFFGSLHPRGRDHVAFRHVEGHFKVAPNAVKLPADVRVAVPSVVVEFTQARVPLGHAVLDAFLVHPTGPTDLSGNLGRPSQLKRHRLARTKRLGEVHDEDSSVFFEFSVLAKSLHPFHVDPAPFVFGQFHNTAAHPAVGVFDGA